MKRLIIVAAVCGVLCGCAGELRDEAAEEGNAEVLSYVVKYQPACHDYEMLYTPHLNEMQYREKMGRMNAQEDAQAIETAKATCLANRKANAAIAAANAQIQAEKERQNDEQERLCEALHPLMVNRCLYNSGVNNLIDGL